VVPFSPKIASLTSIHSSFTRSYATKKDTGSQYHGTTIVSVRRGNKVVIMGDGQVTSGKVVSKSNAKKVRRIGTTVIAGFSGSVADCFTLFDILEQKLEAFKGQLLRAVVEFAKMWRTDRMFHRLEAEIIVADAERTLTITGNGEVMESQDGITATGSGGNYALAAAQALAKFSPDLDAEEICLRSMEVAADMCIYTNNSFTKEVIIIEKKEL